MTSGDWVAEAQEALWHASVQSGIRLEAADQVVVAHELAKTSPDMVNHEVVERAFSTARVAVPSRSFVKAVVGRARLARSKPTVREVILDFRRDAIRNLSRRYGGKSKDEASLRDHLLMYLPKRGYAEAHTGKGQTDILLPPPEDTIIETKVWTTLQRFEDGMEELGEYIRSEGSAHAYMVVFCDREPLPPIITDHRVEVVEERDLEGARVPVIVVPFDVDPPSKLAQSNRRRLRNDT